MVEALESTGQLTYFWYFNNEKIDSLLSQISGRLETERSEETSKGLDRKVSASAEVGGILAALGIGKLTGAGEASKSASTVLTVTATLSAANKVLVLAEYLKRVQQLAVLRIDELSEDAALNALAGHPFQLLHGKFDLKDIDDERATLRSERRNSIGGPMFEVPILYRNAINDQFGMSEDEYVANGVLAQTFVRPGRLVASPIALWYAYVSPLDAAITYWSPASTSLKHPSGLQLTAPANEATA